MEQSVHGFLDQHIENGQMDLVLDYASPVPAILTMKMMGLPSTTGSSTPTSSTRSWPPPDGHEYTKAIAKVPAMIEEVC